MKYKILIILIFILQSHFSLYSDDISEIATNEEKNFDSDFQVAQEAYLNQKYHTAQNAIEKSLHKQPDFVDGHILKAKIYAKRGRVTQSINYLTQQYQLNQDIGYIATRGIILYDHHYYFSAFEDILSAYDNQYEDFDFYWHLYRIRTLCQGFDREETIMYQNYCDRLQAILPKILLNKAIELNHSVPYVWQEKALYEIQNKDFLAAHKSIDVALVLSEDNPKNYQIKNLIYIKEGKLEKALDVLEKNKKIIINTEWYKKLYIDILYALGRKTDIEKSLLNEIKKEPKIAENYFLLSEYYLKFKKHDLVIQYLTQYIKLKPDHLIARNVLSKILWQQKKFDLLIPHLQYLVEHGFNELFPYQSLARLFLIKEQVFSAEKVILKGFYRNFNFNYNIDAIDSQLLFEYALIQEKKLNFITAIKIYQQLIQYNPKNASYLKRLGIAYFSSQQYDKATFYFKESLQLHYSASTKYFLAQNYAMLENDELALETINQLIEDQPNHSEYYIMKSEIEFQNKQYHYALGSINKALQLDPQNLHLKEFEAEILFYLKDYQLAEKTLEKILTYQPNDSVLLKKFIFIKFKNDKNSALAYIDDFLINQQPDIGIIELKNYLHGEHTQLWQFEPESIEAQIYETIIYSEFEKASELIQQAQKNDPKNDKLIQLSIFLSSFYNFNIKYLENINQDKDNWPLIYYALHHQVKIEDGIKILEKMYKKNPSPYISAYLGDLYSSNKNYDKSLYYLKKFIKHYPENNWANIKIAIIYDFKKQVNNAILIYNQILAKNPNHELALNNLAWLYLTTENEIYQKPHDALKHSQKAVALTPTNSNSLDTLAEAFYQTKQYNKALATIEKAMLYDQESLDHFKKQKRKIEKKIIEEKKKNE